jgi:hypothetical protein
MMIAVAIIAVALWSLLLGGRSIYYRYLARAVAAKQQMYLVDSEALERKAARGLTPDEARLAGYGRRMLTYLAHQRARYERAARYPWLPVERDPPVPR